MFEKASRIKLRFTTSKGVVSVEELWDFSLPSLDKMAIAINKEIKNTEGESFLKNTRKTADVKENELRLEILKYIITTKQTEDELAVNAAKRKEEIAKLKSLAEKKRENELEELTLEEINAKIEQLQNGN